MEPLLRPAKLRSKNTSASPAKSFAPPLHGELLTPDQLVRHAEVIAQQHQSTIIREGSNRLLAQLQENERVLREFNRATVAVDRTRPITPATEWLLDNFYLIEEQIQMARRHLPRSYSRELPRLTTGPAAGLPRVYDLMLELIAHADAQIDRSPLWRFVAAYQNVAPLSLGELWAVPIMLRLGLIENLQRITRRLAEAREHRDLADYWIDRLQEMAATNPSHLVTVIAEMAQARLPMTSAFVAEFCARLSRQSSVLHLARNWLEQWLASHSLTIEQLVHQETQHQSADQVSVSHSIGSLRFLSSANWKEFVEDLSLVEQALRGDAAHVYPRMDFASRDRYRHIVESLARVSRHSELEVASEAVRLAASAAQAHGGDDRRAHVGYYLIGRGHHDMEQALGVSWPWHLRLEHTIRRWPLGFYLGGVAIVTAGLGSGFVPQARALGVDGWILALLTVAFVAVASQFAVALMNWLSTLLVSPRLLPRLDYEEGIPAAARTMVVVPTLLSSPAAADRLLETLEIHALANREPNLHFALLTDFCDAPTENLPGDIALVEQVSAGVAELNRRYPGEGCDRFYLFHRPRRWNPGEGRWMGYERKRGKLADLNALLRGGPADHFSVIVGGVSDLPPVKYVITLDTDTQLPRDAARRLVGTMAHPLNQPVFDDARGVVTEGYSILQPRVAVSLPGARRSWFVRLCAGEAGIDPYTRAVSDVYQDVFGEGSFIGKGIYDVDAFERALGGRFPENTVLSHDLLESCHARSALVSDVEFYEEYPSRYIADAGRRHRWIRGDWQITNWLLPRVPGPDARRIANPLSALSQWKIFDNLRRSLVPAALLIFLIGSWLLTPIFAPVALQLVLGLLVVPSLLPLILAAARPAADLPWSVHLRGLVNTAGRQACQIFLTLAFLPFDAFISVDAVVRALSRLLVTRRKLLEWQTASEADAASRKSLAGFYLKMWFSPILAIGVVTACAVMSLVDLSIVLPFGVLWFVAPWIAWSISQPIPEKPAGLSRDDVEFLHRSARKTWSFFETFANEQENWLPPDNYQETPTAVVASRTSPTNIGLALLAGIAARDFGYLATRALITRTTRMFETLGKLEQYRGHFYNWYDTRTLQPLLPLYVSTVDSGNLAGHLLTLGSALREIPDEPVFPAQFFAGARDTFALLLAAAPDHPGVAELGQLLTASPAALTLSGACATLGRIVAIAGRLESLPDEGHRWATALRCDAEAHLADLHALVPWLERAGPAAEPPAAIARFNRAPTLRQLAGIDRVLAEHENRPDASVDLAVWRAAGTAARERIAQIEALAARSDALADMDFSFLFDSTRNLFTIGFNLTERRRDASFYDLLASEARLCSYVAIAQGQVPQDHWFALGRRLVAASGGEPTLVSWSGSMFEYLMPQLVMPNHENTLLDHTCRSAVRHQIDYGRAHNVPWGISESGYHRTDAHLNYQYRAFGVPGLGLKRGLSEDLVIAPYATVMALMVAPREACANLRRLTREGREGDYGFYEAIDYTASRLPRDETSATIRSFMAHHQGMSLLALLYLLRDRPMQRRFLACRLLKAAELLLQERVPKAAASLFSADLELEEAGKRAATDNKHVMRVFSDPSAGTPEVHLLSNGRYHVVVSSAGGGYSRWRDLALTRWREDATRDCWGLFIYLRDLVSADVWSVAHQPTRRTEKPYEAIFTQGRAEFRHRHADIETHTEISVSPEDDIELRRITLVNHGSGTRTVELTSYAEVVLAHPNADAAHPAFSNLFVQTEFLADSAAILCTRRARTHGETPPWLLHMLVGGGHDGVSCETDRARFIGRGGSTLYPAALREAGPLGNSAGSVLDPIVALRRPLILPPGEKVVVDLVLGATEDRSRALALVEKYQNARMAERAFELAWTHSQVTLRQLGANEADAQLYGRLTGALIYADPARRAAASVLRTNRRGQNGLWSYGISGDMPIVVLRIGDSQKLDLVRQVVLAHAYWRLKGLRVELVILNEDSSVYRQSLHEEITRLIASTVEAHEIDKPGGIFIRRTEQIPPEDRVLLQSVARVVLEADQGAFAQQLEKRPTVEPLVPALVPTRSPFIDNSPPLAPRELIFANGLGGFTSDGREYVITLARGQATPAPWVNVLANPFFGTVVSERGGAYTWLENAHEYRLTPWHNDAVQDPTGEAFYLRDEHTGQFWSPMPAPARGTTPYVIRHGFGYTIFEHSEGGIASETCVYVALDAPVKFVTVKLRNVSGRARRLSVTGYWEWVLGELRAKNLLHVQTEVDLSTGALLATNPYNVEFADRVAFVDVHDPARTLTGDRREFIGRNGDLAGPAAMRRARLSGRVGAGLDPCAALQVAFDLADGQEKEICFRLGAGRGVADAQTLIHRYRRPGESRAALEKVWEFWKSTLGAVHVETPDRAVNVMANGWLLYQTLACRIWGRTGFYQSGGAYGFRDQLQDVMALVHAQPALAREHILRAAARQFREGDVQHWWHPPAGRGVRTHFSDDYLWLPHVVCHYVKCVGDTGVLDERVNFLEGRPVRPEEEAYYDLPARSEEADTLYGHCVRAIRNGLKFGAHGLPLIGCGDWNDGMNMIGEKGRGESVWLAFFLYDVLVKFGALARGRNDIEFAERCAAEARTLRDNIELHGWDGEWYRRAYFDDGEPLGSKTNEECQIDALPQSWAVISGAADPARARQGLDAVDQRLVRREARLIQLFDPPFDKSHLNPGYIKGYIPGVRENGGQYTHGALWTVMAYALIGDSDRAWELFNLLNPVHHGSTPENMATYKVEPYVVAADVYGVAPHTGRGGWTWYTGSAGWMYRLLTETLLGLHLENGHLRIIPRVPRAWPAYKIHYRYRQTTYHITVQPPAPNGTAKLRLIVDGQESVAETIQLTDDRREHWIEVQRV